mmetsp:Transcript_354/g.222  ORF Transcript_354/g.222 Transcript_354/m.222 type:complete len:151 (+) Transcript_354:67-519(+)
MNSLTGWHHLAAVIDIDGFVTFYVDFERVGEGIELDYSFDISYIGNDAAYRYPWGVAIDEVRFWDAALDLTELLDYYHFEVASDDTRLVIYYKFNEGTGVVIKNEVEVEVDPEGEGLWPTDAILEGGIWLEEDYCDWFLPPPTCLDIGGS